MFLDGNKLFYLSLFENDKRISAAGFLRLVQMEERLLLEGKIQCKNPCEGIYELNYLTRGEALQGNLGSVRLQKGQGLVRLYVEKEIGALADNDGLLFYLQIDTGTSIATGDKPVPKEAMMTTAVLKEVQTSLPQTDVSREAVSEVKMKSCDLQAEFFRPGDMAWEEMKKRFEQVNPFGDERVYLTLDLRDLHLLREGESKLSHNSFLLHGYYNYRHLILGKDQKVGRQNEMCYYLGVPGVFYEKEKMAAVMFGFEAFECKGAVTIGKYGYYLRQIEILE